MKNLLIAITFTLFSLALPLTMAQQVVENEAAATKVPIKDSKAVKDSKPVKDGLTITVNMDDAEEAEQEVKKVIKVFKKVLGEEAGRELEAELEGLDKDEREQLHELFRDGVFSHGGGMSGGEFVIALVAICFTLGLPIIILITVLIFGHRKRKQKMELISAYLAANQPVPDRVMAEFGSDMKGGAGLRSALTLTLVGAAVSIFFMVVGATEAAALGLIPIGIGIARLISLKYEQDKEST